MMVSRKVNYQQHKKRDTFFACQRPNSVYMGDSIRLMYELIHDLNYKNLPGLRICIDFEKAFDSVDWLFRRKVLKAFGFSPVMCQCIYTFN